MRFVVGMATCSMGTALGWSSRAPPQGEDVGGLGEGEEEGLEEDLVDGEDHALRATNC